MAVGLPENIFLTKLDAAANWARSNSLWPMPFATACCGIELMATAASRHDLARFGAEVMRFSPRQCDLLIVAGRVVMKMLPVLQRIWLQMPEPKWCISMGACACSGGVFDTYAVVQGVDRFIPVDMYVPGCPPRPEQLLAAVMDMQAKVRRTGTIMGKEFMARDTPMGPQPFESEERYRIQEANLVQLGNFSAAMTPAGMKAVDLMGSDPQLTVAEAKNGGVFASIPVMKGSDPIKSTPRMKRGADQHG